MSECCPKTSERVASRALRTRENRKFQSVASSPRTLTLPRAISPGYGLGAMAPLLESLEELRGLLQTLRGFVPSAGDEAYSAASSRLESIIDGFRHGQAPHSNGAPHGNGSGDYEHAAPAVRACLP